MPRNHQIKSIRECKESADVASARALNALASELHAANGEPNSFVPVLPITDDGKQLRRTRLEQKQQHKPERFRATATDHK